MKKKSIFLIITTVLVILCSSIIISCESNNEEIITSSISLDNNKIKVKLIDLLPDYFNAKYELYAFGKNNILKFYDLSAQDKGEKMTNDIRLNRYINESVFGSVDIGEYSFSNIKVLSLDKNGNVYIAKIQAFEKEVFFENSTNENWDSSGYSSYIIHFVIDSKGIIKLIEDIEIDEASRIWRIPQEIEEGQSIDTYIKNKKNNFKISSIEEGFNLQQRNSRARGAVRYALKYVFNRDQNTCDYSEGGGDCTNFVSNAMHKGGKIKQKSRKWFHKYTFCFNSRRIYSLSWTVADDFYRYMKNSSIMYNQSIPLNNLKVGDIISFGKKGKRRAVHTAIVTKIKNSKTYVTYRNGGGYPPKKNKKLSSISLKVLQTFRPRY